MNSNYTPEETELMYNLLFVNLIKENKLLCKDIINFTPRLLELYLDNVDTSLDNQHFTYEIRTGLLSYFIQDNNLKKIEILKDYLDSYAYYLVFDLLHILDKPLNLSDSLTNILNTKLKETVKDNYLRKPLLNKIIDNKSCLSKIYYFN